MEENPLNGNGKKKNYSRKNLNIREWIHLQSITITPGVNEGFTYNLQNLHSNIDSLPVGDGEMAQIENYKVSMRVTSNVLAFAIKPFIIQTAGTFTSQSNLSERRVHTMLDGSIDDEFGYQPTAAARMSVAMPIDQGHVAPSLRISGAEFEFTLPKRVIQLLNKETQTERMQTLYLGVIGIGPNGYSIVIRNFIEIRYIIVAKGLVIR
jgi:hypothetical protein